MSGFQPFHKKPKGIYKASSVEFSCSRCAYYEKKRCHLHHRDMNDPSRQKCADFLRADHSINLSPNP